MLVMPGDTGEPTAAPWRFGKIFPKRKRQLLSSSCEREITFSLVKYFPEMASSFLIFMFCKFPIYDFKGCWYLNAGKKGTHVKRQYP